MKNPPIPIPPTNSPNPINHISENQGLLDAITTPTNTTTAIANPNIMLFLFNSDPRQDFLFLCFELFFGNYSLFL